MSRNGSGVYSLPAGSTVSDGTTATAAQHNTPLSDLETDMNTARPVVAGGTGATTAAGARTALGAGTMSDLSDDATPTLGGPLDGNGEDLNHLGVMFLTEQAAAEADVAGKGQIWVETATPNVLKFTDDAGTDFNVATSADLVGQQTIWIPAGAMEPRVTTAPATSNAVEIGTSLLALRTMDFATDADDHAGFAIQMPKGWDESTLVAQFIWSTTGAQTAGFDGVAWFIRAGAYASSDVLTTALGTAVGVTQDHSATADDVMVTSETAAITVAGTPGAEEWVYFEVYRDVSDAADDLDIDARLHGVKIHYTTDALTDD